VQVPYPSAGLNHAAVERPRAESSTAPKQQLVGTVPVVATLLSFVSFASLVTEKENAKLLSPSHRFRHGSPTNSCGKIF
jgi:hypothetical protein